MKTMQHCEVSYRMNGNVYQGTLRIEQQEGEQTPRYRAVIETSALRGTYSGYASTVELALDFLNLAMQAEGADEIHVACKAA